MDILDNAFITRHFEASSHDPNGLLGAYEEGLSNRIMETLWRTYGGYNWGVAVDAAQGIARVQIGGLMRSSYWEIIYLDRLASDPGMLSVKRAGGKLLEMLKLRRDRADRDSVRELTANKGILSFDRPMAGMDTLPVKKRFATRQATAAENNTMRQLYSGAPTPSPSLLRAA